MNLKSSLDRFIDAVAEKLSAEIDNLKSSLDRFIDNTNTERQLTTRI